MVEYLLVFAFAVLSSLTGTITQSCPTQDGYRYDDVTGLCVKVLTDWLTWDNAKAECERMNDHLVFVDTEQKNTFLKSILSAQAWIGCRYDGISKFIWTNGTEIVYSNWDASGQPDYSGQCVVVASWYAYNWDDAPCTNEANAVCEKSISDINTTSTATSSTTTTTTASISPFPSLLTSENPDVITTLEPHETTLEQAQGPVITVADSTESPTPNVPMEIVASSISASSSISIVNTPNVYSSEINKGISYSKTIAEKSSEQLSTQQTLMDSTINSLVPSGTYLVNKVETTPVYSSIQNPHHITSASMDSTTQIALNTLEPTSSIDWTSSTCACFCKEFTTLTARELMAIQAEIRRRLLLDTKILTKTIAKYKSASDNRKSSVSIGSAGIVILVVCGCLILVGDLDYIVKFFGKRKRNNLTQ